MTFVGEKYRGYVAFITNQIKTHFFAAIAARLSNAGVRVLWIATSARWADVARREAGASPEDILDLSEAGSEWTKGRAPSRPRPEALGRIERAGGLSINDMIIMDRELNRRPWRFGLAYAAAVARRVDQFLEGRGIDFCFGETTWCGELLVAQLVRVHGGTYAQPTTIRIPSENFGLLEDVATDRLFEWTVASEDNFRQAREIVAVFARAEIKPYYMSSLTSPLRWSSHWTEEAKIAFFTNTNRFDYSVPPIYIRAFRRLLWAWNAISANRVAFQQGPSRPDAPYVLVTAHVQPEASVDVWGAPFNNQVEVIRALSRILPVGCEILVKEHRAAIGCRSRAVYDELSRIPGVRLIHYGADTPSLIRGAQLVASPAGTACYEAALMGVPAVCFGHVFFGRALVQDGFDPFEMDRARMAAFLDDIRAARERGDIARRAEQFLAHTVANSFPWPIHRSDRRLRHERREPRPGRRRLAGGARLPPAPCISGIEALNILRRTQVCIGYCRGSGWNLRVA